jgi:hypothetical protein
MEITLHLVNGDPKYNEERFVTRQSRLGGTGYAPAKLRRALRTEITKAALESLYSSISRPFGSPGTGKIAV